MILSDDMKDAQVLSLALEVENGGNTARIDTYNAAAEPIAINHDESGDSLLISHALPDNVFQDTVTSTGVVDTNSIDDAIGTANGNPTYSILVGRDGSRKAILTAGLTGSGKELIFQTAIESGKAKGISQIRMQTP